MFGGFGPIVLGIIFYILSCTLEGFAPTGSDVLMGVVSTYLLAIVQAGASVFNQLEHWPLPKALLCHFGVLYLAYSICYIANRWIPFDPLVLVIFTAIMLPVQVAFFFVHPLLYWMMAFIVGIHLGGCCGDGFLILLLLVRFKDPRTLMRDTGPEQYIYIPNP